MEVDDAPPEDVGKTQEHGEEDGEASSGEEGELSDDSPQHMTPASPVAVTPVKHDPVASDRVKAHHDSMSGSEDNLINCSTSPVDKQLLAKSSSEDHNASENTEKILEDDASGDNVNHDACTEPAVNNVDGLNGDDGKDDAKVIQEKNEKQRLLKTSLHDETVELDYEEEGMEDNESLANTGGDDANMGGDDANMGGDDANTGGDDSKELELGELDEKVHIYWLHVSTGQVHLYYNSPYLCRCLQTAGRNSCSIDLGDVSNCSYRLTVHPVTSVSVRPSIFFIRKKHI